MPKFVVAIHGICNRETRPSWNWEFQLWLALRRWAAVCQTFHYEAGPFPRWNKWVTNPRQAKVVVERIRLLDAVPDGEGEVPICFVAHSNGACIALESIKRLSDLGKKVETAIFVGGAIESDVVVSGLDDLLAEGWLKRAIAYVSPRDVVTKWLEVFSGAYGALGAKGFLYNDRKLGAWLQEDEGLNLRIHGERLVTRVWPGAGHSGYFDSVRVERVFDAIARDLCLDQFCPERDCDRGIFEMVRAGQVSRGSVRDRMEVGG